MFRKDRKSPAYQQELYQLHHRRIYNTCLRIVGNQMDAEEIMHDVFLKLFDSIEDLHDEKAFCSWSRSIAVRTSIDRMRIKKTYFEQIDDNMQIADEAPEEEPEMELTVEAVKSELKNLPEGYRIVLTMRLFEECEFEDIAKFLQIKESTVRSQYVRGREKLAKMLKSKIYDNE